MKRISLPHAIHCKARCTIKSVQLGDIGDKFKSYEKTYVITLVKTIQSKDAPKLYKECGYKSVEDWKRGWMEHRLFPPNPQDIVYAHYFEEVKRK